MKFKNRCLAVFALILVLLSFFLNVLIFPLFSSDLSLGILHIVARNGMTLSYFLGTISLLVLLSVLLFNSLTALNIAQQIASVMAVTAGVILFIAGCIQLNIPYSMESYFCLVISMVIPFIVSYIHIVLAIFFLKVGKHSIRTPVFCFVVAEVLYLSMVTIVLTSLPEGTPNIILHITAVLSSSFARLIAVLIIAIIKID